MVINVADAIMGSGKSTACINYINAHPSEKFLYITPYLDEAKRIKDGCPAHNFVEPSDKLAKFHYTKLAHCKYLLLSGENITSTHKLFSLFDEETISAIKEKGYTLIIDEVIDVFSKANYKTGDIQILIDSGCIREVSGSYETTGVEYSGARLQDLFTMLKYNRLIKINDEKSNECFYYWVFPKEILLAFKNVFVLTYLFDSNDMKYYFDTSDIAYKKIGVSHTEDDSYQFSEAGALPQYVTELKEKVHVFKNEKLNEIGEDKYAISDNWFNRVTPTDISRLKKNVYNFYRNYNKDVAASKRMWSTYEKRKDQLSGKGYTSGYVIFNKRASNEYRDKTVLAYCANVFTRPEKKQYFSQFGIEYDEEGYALSILVQWIWRSAIRDGKEIWIYVPSRRMRELLIGWIDSFGNTE